MNTCPKCGGNYEGDVCPFCAEMCIRDSGQAALHLPREVHVAGRVDELDDASAVFQPGAGGFH